MLNRNPENLLTRIKQGKHILMDGALGTELERRGVPFDGAAWSALAVRDYGEVIRQTHEDYLSADAQIHIVNSFALARHVLEPVGLGDQFEYLNRQSVALFDEALTHSGKDRNTVWVAGSLSTFAAHSDRSTLPTGDALSLNYRDQAQILYDAGVDLFVLEMLFDVDVSLVMLKAVKEFNLPVIIGFTCDRSDQVASSVVSARGMGSTAVPLEEILPKVIDAIESDNVILSIMHSDLDVTNNALAILKRYWNGPIAIYPNSGHFVKLHLQFESVCSVEAFNRAANRWFDEGVQIVGGCCGIGPDHIAYLSTKSNESF
ncbi:MAG: S-methylmethionine-dependent homocysteine/selenocysteine methylase [Gammaproteobacteria bacterium]|jgi:S-methylmethionine-dependent homocysteine/selenocysteine methylase